jgi:predicted RNase H-like nuclease (RuvC/YqgF family)
MPCVERSTMPNDLLPPAVRQSPEARQFIVLIETMIAEFAEAQKSLQRATARIESLTDVVDSLQQTIHALTARLVEAEQECRDDTWLGHEW